MLTISKKSDYGLLVIQQLMDQTDFVPLSKLVKITRLPQRFVARIAADLVRHKILSSREGKNGGYKILRNLNTITLFDFLKIFNDNPQLVQCLDPRYVCSYKKLCKHTASIKNKVSIILLRGLRSNTLRDVLT